MRLLRFFATGFLVFALACTARAQMRCDAPRSPAFTKYERVLPDDPWFEVYRLPGDVYAIWEPRQAEHVFSWLIVGEKRALLFDTGMGIAPIERVTSQLTKLPVSVLNSHTHHDHVGGNHAFHSVYGADTPFTRNNAEHGYGNADMASQVEANSVCPPLPDGVSPSTYTVKAFHIDRTVHDGEVIDLGGRQLKVILTPGHTPDSLCLLDPAQHEMFTGDTYYPGSLWLWAPETDLDAYQRSMERLAAFAKDVDVLRPAHGSLEADPAMLGKVATAMPGIRAGKVPYTVRNNRRVYRLDGFSVTMANP